MASTFVGLADEEPSSPHLPTTSSISLAQIGQLGSPARTGSNCPWPGDAMLSLMDLSRTPGLGPGVGPTHCKPDCLRARRGAINRPGRKGCEAGTATDGETLRFPESKLLEDAFLSHLAFAMEETSC